MKMKRASKALQQLLAPVLVFWLCPSPAWATGDMGGLDDLFGAVVLPAWFCSSYARRIEAGPRLKLAAAIIATCLGPVIGVSLLGPGKLEHLHGPWCLLIPLTACTVTATFLRYLEAFGRGRRPTDWPTLVLTFACVPIFLLDMILVQSCRSFDGCHPP
jgi:hypothetical protein